MFGQSSKLVPKKAIFATQPVEVNAWGSLDQIFRLLLLIYLLIPVQPPICCGCMFTFVVFDFVFQY